MNYCIIVFYLLGTVRERVGNGRQYIIEWADQTVQLQVLTITVHSLNGGMPENILCGRFSNEHFTVSFASTSFDINLLPFIFPKPLFIDVLLFLYPSRQLYFHLFVKITVLEF